MAFFAGESPLRRSQRRRRTRRRCRAWPWLLVGAVAVFQHGLLRATLRDDYEGIDSYTSYDSSQRTGYFGAWWSQPPPEIDVYESEADRAFRASLPVTDPRHTPRLVKIDPNDLPPPVFHGCTSAFGRCRFSNVCYSAGDGLLVPDVPGFRETQNQQPNSTPGTDDRLFERWYEPDGTYGRILSVPRQPRMVPAEIYRNWTNVWMVPDLPVLAMNCWQQKQREFNPAHTLMGHGKLFVHGTRIWDLDAVYNERPQESLHPTFGVLLYHQCSPVEGWAWGEFVRDLIWNYTATQQSKRVHGPRHAATLYLPYAGSPGLPRGPDLVVCGATVHQAPHYEGHYFDRNDAHVLSEWDKVVREQVVPTHHADDDHQKDHDPAGDRCRKSLRIAAWQRTEGTSLRLFRNLDEIEAVVKEVSDHDLEILTADASTPPEEQAKIFRSFDVLLTPHGSHNVNMIFSERNKPVFIEVSAVFYDAGPATNGRFFAADWISSLGHPPYDNPVLQSKQEVCLAAHDNEAECPRFPVRSNFVHSDLLVDAAILRRDLSRAAAVLCDGGAPGASAG